MFWCWYFIFQFLRLTQWGRLRCKIISPFNFRTSKLFVEKKFCNAVMFIKILETNKTNTSAFFYVFVFRKDVGYMYMLYTSKVRLQTTCFNHHVQEFFLENWSIEEDVKSLKLNIKIFFSVSELVDKWLRFFLSSFSTRFVFWLLIVCMRLLLRCSAFEILLVLRFRAILSLKGNFKTSLCLATVSFETFLFFIWTSIFVFCESDFFYIFTLSRPDLK